MIRAYASRTGTKRNLAALRDHGWGLLLSAYGAHRDEGFADHMLDPGTWSTRAGADWDERKFIDLLDSHGRSSAQTIAPDIVAGGRASLELSLAWLPSLAELGRPVLLAAQDGLEPVDLRPHLSADVGIAVGGSTAWKWRELSRWCELARVVGCRVHVLRANSARMIRWAGACGADSFDGSGPSKFAECLPRFDGGRLDVQTTMTGLGLPSPFKPRS